ncbi:hypothetical protein PM082_024727 [Marasmius tenuissimus]|nr:hypothetical protein PM082_024727 [Marasmius tenuissimus]
MPKNARNKTRIISTSATTRTEAHNYLRATNTSTRQTRVYVENQRESQTSQNTSSTQDTLGYNDGPPDISNLGADSDQSVEEDVVRVKVVEKMKRYEDSDLPLLTWSREYRDGYLDWNMITEGRGRIYHKQRTCGRCTSSRATWRCLDCFGLRLVCRDCLINSHLDEPLHRIEEWKNDFFHPSTLKDVGLRFQLGHKAGERCALPQPGHKDFVVLSWNGIHNVNLDFCGCDTIDRHLQLMEIGWWPASYKEPQTAATFQLLRNYHITNLQSQTAPTDFNAVLEQITCGTGLTKLPDREAQFLLILREWRNIKMLKRCGRCHDPDGIAATPAGAAAVPCRACPHPGKNMPDDWEKAPAEEQFLHGLYLAEDANFKQKARARPNDHRDPPLSLAAAFWVPQELYMHEVTKHPEKREISHCSSFSAMAQANSRKLKGLRATGIGSVTCARHGTFCPNGMGDLQKGERYANMDFLALFSLLSCAVVLVFFSYDIACQWMINFYSRMKAFPPFMQIPSCVTMKFKVPKFHLVGHIKKCWAPFSFNYTEGGAKTDGEAVERNWAWLNAVARSVSMMRAGGCWDTIDDFANFWNYRKMVKSEKLLMKNMVKVLPEAVINARVFSAFNDALKDDHANDVAEWLDQVVRWEAGLDKFCPYEIKEPEISVAKMKKVIAKEERRRAELGEASMKSNVILRGLEIEESQRTLRAAMSQKKQTDTQQSENQAKAAKLLNSICSHRQTLLGHIPALRQLMEDQPPEEQNSPCEMCLFFPSAINQEIRAVTCPKDLIRIEEQLREAQCYDFLARLRAQLQARTVAYKNASRLIPSQGLFTRTRILQNSIEKKINLLSSAYRAARKALLSLRGDGAWARVLKELRDEDVRGISERVVKEMEREERERAENIAGVTHDDFEALLENNIPTAPFNPVLTLGQTKQHLSWIWYTYKNVEGTDALASTFDELKDNLRVEWCKARANACRAHEEVRLIEEEMRRSIQFCFKQSGWWREQVGRRTEVPEYLAEGLTAYAKEHEEVEMAQGLRWTRSWAKIRSRAKEVLHFLASDDNEGSLPSLPAFEVEIDAEEDVDSGDEGDDLFE